MLFIHVNGLVYVCESDEVLDFIDQEAMAVVEEDKFNEEDYK